MGFTCQARRHFSDIDEGRTELDHGSIQAMWLNHPQGCLGFRLEAGGKVLVYATDNEPGDPVFDKNLRKLAEGADVLIYDAQYLPEEYTARKQGWGHSHWREAINIVMESGAKELILFHHDPDRNDEAVERIEELAGRHFPASAAREDRISVRAER